MGNASSTKKGILNALSSSSEPKVVVGPSRLWPIDAYSLKLVRPSGLREQEILPVRPIQYYLGLGPKSSLLSLCLHQVAIEFVLDLLEDDSNTDNKVWMNRLAQVPQALHLSLWSHMCQWIFPTLTPPTRQRRLDEMQFIETETFGEHEMEWQWQEIPRRVLNHLRGIEEITDPRLNILGLNLQRSDRRALNPEALQELKSLQSSINLRFTPAKQLLYNDLMTIGKGNITHLDLSGPYNAQDQPPLCSKVFRLIADGFSHLKHLSIGGFIISDVDIDYWVANAKSKLTALHASKICLLGNRRKLFTLLRHHKSTLEQISFSHPLLLHSFEGDVSVFEDLQQLRSIFLQKEDRRRVPSAATERKVTNLLSNIFQYSPAETLQHSLFVEDGLNWDDNDHHLRNHCIAFLERAKVLETFYVHIIVGIDTGASMLPALAKSPALSYVELPPTLGPYWGIDIAGFSLFANRNSFSSLTHLGISDYWPQDADAEPLWVALSENLAPRLLTLEIEGSINVTYLSILVSSCTSLRSLKMQFVRCIGESWFGSILVPAVAETLQSLVLRDHAGPRITDESIAHLSSLQALEVLRVDVEGVTAKCLYELLLQLPALRLGEVRWSRPRRHMMEITDPYFFAIARMPNLVATHSSDFERSRLKDTAGLNQRFGLTLHNSV